MAASYQQFYLEQKDRLFSYLIYKCRDRELAADITQESFTRHYQSYGSQKTYTPSLLFTIARNALVDHQRERVNRTQLATHFPEPVTDAESKCITKETQSHLHQAIEKLPEKEKEILILVVSGMPYKDIADFLGISLANVKVKVHRARTRLRGILNNEEQS